MRAAEYTVWCALANRVYHYDGYVYGVYGMLYLLVELGAVAR